MKNKYTYKAFGLNILSEFEVPELIGSSGTPDVYIQFGKVPDYLPECKSKGVKYEATKDQFLLTVDNVARYYVEKGKQIIVELLKKDADKEVRLFLLGSAFGALFIQRGLLPIHGSAIDINNKICIFSGVSGVGKSSTAASFVKKGYSFLADDISVINNDLMLQPSFPNLKIWDDILKKIEPKTKKLKQIRPEIKKYDLRYADQFCDTPKAVDIIFIIASKNSPGFEYEELSGIAKFNAVKSNTYRYKFVGGLEKQFDHFQIMNKLLPKIKVFRIFRPQAPIMLDDFANFILEIVKNDA